MRWTRTLAVAGVIVVAAAVVWRPVAEPRLVKFPAHVDVTMHYAGTASTFVDASTSAALATPTVAPLTIDRHIQTMPGGGAHTAVLLETLTITSGGRVQVERNQYVIDRRSMQNVRSPLSWAIDASNVVDRSGTYYVTLPMGTDARKSYDIWKSEAGTSYPITDDPSAPTRVAGVSTVGLAGSLAPTRVIPQEEAALAARGLPVSLSPAQAQARLAAAGVDLGAATRTLAAALSPAELVQVTKALATPVALRYFWEVRGSAAINHTTGALVEIPSADEIVLVQPDLGALAGLGPMLASHASAPGVATLQRQLGAVLGASPQPVYEMTYQETAASAAATAGRVSDQLTQIRVVRTIVPWGLATLGVVLLVGAGVTSRRPRRETPDALPLPAAAPARHQRAA